MFAGIFSLLTLGTFPKSNEFASTYLDVTNVIPIIYLSAIGILTCQPLPSRP